MLEIRRLSAGYPGGGRVLHEMDLSIGKGAFVAVLGRNGMGKTTLMKAICGLLPSETGEIRLDGQDLTPLRVYARAQRGIGYVPQGREVFKDFTVEENLRVGRIAKPGLSPIVPEALYALFPILKERAGQKAGSLSGGQQQQLAIARALAGEPRLLLLDEPAEGIQPNIVQEIARKLREIVDETGLTVLMVEQNLAMVDGWADSIAFMDHGRIAESGVPAKGIRADRYRLSTYLSI